MRELTHLTFTALLLAGTFGADSVLAQSRRYNGPRVDYDFQTRDPGRFSQCDSFQQNNMGTHLKVCQFASAEAVRMANVYARQEGRIEGYHRGYAWGLNQGIDQNISNVGELRRGAAELRYYENKLAVADEMGIDKAEADATPLAAQEVRSRFNQAVGSGALPNNRFQVPQSYYAGEANAFERFVGKVPTVNEVIRRDRYNNYLVVYNDFDRTYRDSPYSRRRVYDMYSNDGIYRPTFDRYSNQDQILNLWLDRRIDSYVRYERLNQGAPTNPDGSLVTDFQDLFRSIFTKSYMHYSRHAFSRAFNDAIDLGFIHGEDTGLEIGAEIARARGLQNAFDQEFRIRSVNSYKDQFHRSYADSFEATYADYQNNAKLSIELLEVIGEVNDGIIQPGERVALKFKVRNAGGKGSELRISASGDITSGSVEQKSIAALKESVFTTGLIATVDPRLGNRARANVVLNVNGMTDSVGTNVSYLIQMTGRSADLNALGGTAMVTVTSENVSTVATGRAVKATLDIAGKKFEAIGTTLEPGQVQKLAIDVSGLDPYELITGSINGQLSLKLGDQVIESKSISLSSNNSVNDTVEYFDQLANNRGVIPAGIGAGSQTQKVLERLVSLNDSETDRTSGRGGENIYRKDPASTMVGKIRDTKLNREQTDAAKAQYSRLGNILMKASDKFKGFLGIAPKKKAYKKIVEEIIRN